MFIVRGRAARDKRLNCPQSAELTSHVESVRPLSDEKILIGPPTHSRRRRDGQHRSGCRADGGAGPSDPGGWSCPDRATGPGALQDRQADQDLGRSRTPGYPDGPATSRGPAPPSVTHAQEQGFHHSGQFGQVGDFDKYFAFLGDENVQYYPIVIFIFRQFQSYGI